jgi:hypothetical protein
MAKGNFRFVVLFIGMLMLGLLACKQAEKKRAAESLSKKSVAEGTCSAKFPTRFGLLRAKADSSTSKKQNIKQL